MSQPEGEAVRILGLPWHVAAFQREDGLIVLWDGEHEALIENRKRWREGVVELENARRAACAARVADDARHLLGIQARIDGA